MEVIGFGEEDHRAWVAAGWAFRYVLDEASKLCPNDKEVIDALDFAAAAGYLQVQFIDAALATRIANVIRRVAEAESGKTGTSSSMMNGRTPGSRVCANF
jgi:hypothetical protein